MQHVPADVILTAKVMEAPLCGGPYTQGGSSSKHVLHTDEQCATLQSGDREKFGLQPRRKRYTGLLSCAWTGTGDDDDVVVDDAVVQLTAR